MLELVALAKLVFEKKMTISDETEEPLHLEDGAGNPVRHDDAGNADANDQERQRRDEHHEHLPLLTTDGIGVPLQTERVRLQTALLVFQSLVLRSRSFVEYRGKRSEEHTSELQSPCNLVCR